MNNRLVENLPLCIAIHVVDILTRHQRVATYLHDLMGSGPGNLTKLQLDNGIIRDFRSIVLANIKADDEPVAVSSATVWDGRANTNGDYR